MAMIVGPRARLERGSATAALFHALAEPTRLAMLGHLSDGEHRVRDLVDSLHLAQSTVSKHLACLRGCGLVTVRSEGRASWFSLTDPAGLADLVARAEGLLSASGASPSLRDHLAHDEHAGRDDEPPIGGEP